MTDRELIEAAARAANVQGTWASVHQAYGDETVEGIDTGAAIFWNPLRDDGDALRLAVKLRLHIQLWDGTPGYVRAIGKCAPAEAHEPLIEDDMAATRRAIVRAAAAMQVER